MAKALLDIPDPLHHALRVAAATEKRPQYRLIREALEQYLLARGFRVAAEDQSVDWVGTAMESEG